MVCAITNQTVKALVMTLRASTPTNCHDRPTIVQPVNCIRRLPVDSEALFIWFARQMPSFATGLS
jgi:hypothetical protein